MPTSSLLSSTCWPLQWQACASVQSASNLQHYGAFFASISVVVVNREASAPLGLSLYQHTWWYWHISGTKLSFQGDFCRSILIYQWHGSWMFVFFCCNADWCCWKPMRSLHAFHPSWTVVTLQFHIDLQPRPQITSQRVLWHLEQKHISSSITFCRLKPISSDVCIIVIKEYVIINHADALRVH